MASDSTISWKVLAVAATAGAVLGVLSLHPWRGTPSNTVNPAKATGPAAPAGIRPNMGSAAAALPQASGGATTAQVDAWLAGASGDDPALRLESIRALAAAPRDRAVPVLARIARRGMDERERDAALGALEVQAAQQGDADDAIHGVLRMVVSEGRDEQLAERAQRMLEALDAGNAR